MMYLFLVPALAAAIWAWRLAEGSAKYYRDQGVEIDQSKKTIANELEMAIGDLNEAKYRRLHDASLHADALHELKKQLETANNEIDGLNIDKIHLKFKNMTIASNV